jgi:1,4-alpha-glucan branching enzyme
MDASLDALVQPERALADFRRRYRRSATLAAPDVVHVHGFRLDTTAAAAIAARDGFPVVYTEHSTLGEGEDHWGPIPDMRWTYLDAVDVVTSVSRQTRSIVSAMLPVDEPVLPARHPIAAPDSPTVGRHRSAGEELAVLCTSRFSTEKGLEVLVDAAALLVRRAVPFRLTLAGAGTLDPELVNRITALGLESVVHVLGGYEPRQASELLRSADVVVSTSHTEGLPLSLLEAFAAGAPVIATDVGGVSELVVHEVNGLLVPPRNPEATASAIARLAVDEALRLRLAAQASRTFERGGHSPAEVATNNLEHYALARSRAARRTSPPVGALTARASRLTLAGSIFERYRASFSRAAPPARRWRSAWSRSE